MQSQLQLGIAKQNELVGKLKVATEKALIDANYMKSVKVQTLQAFTIYMVYQIIFTSTSWLMYLRFPNVGLKCQDHILFWSVYSLDSQNVRAYIERQRAQRSAPLNVKYDDYYGTRSAFSISV